MQTGRMCESRLHCGRWLAVALLLSVVSVAGCTGKPGPNGARHGHGAQHGAFHDITTGSNVMTIPYPGGSAGYQAGPGWDPVTGWGTPDAQVLVPLLAG